MESSLAQPEAMPDPERPKPARRLPGWLSAALDPAPYCVSRWVFLRLLGLVYLCAFSSLWVQLDGLMGSRGILPAGRLMQAARTQLEGNYHLFPTLLWFSASDRFLHGLTAGGTLLAALLTAGVAPVPMLCGLWILYLSLSLGGQVFFSFQWDILLLEAGFLAVWIAPLTLSPAGERRAPVSRPAVWLLWWLLFRLMFESGVVKLGSGDPTWAGLTALQYHYETQPLPTWIGWYAHQLPAGVQTLSAACLLAIELAVPFLIFTTALLRRTACAVLASLQLLILLTGNYCFFNVLTIALCVLLLEDAVWPSGMRRFVPGAPAASGVKPARLWPAAVIIPVTAVMFALSLVPTMPTIGLGMPLPQPLVAFYDWVQPFRSINSYGLFAVMTTERPEIIVEGSQDGRLWQPYEFRYKPGDLSRRPAFVEPHQPRLDWQMWFAALGSVDGNPWFLRFEQRLLEGSPDVEALLAANPFPEKPPLAIRAVVFDYHFTNREQRAATGDWWRRENQREYCPAVKLNEEGQLILFEPVPQLEPVPSRSTP